MAASASSLGRDIVFNLRLKTDSNDWAALKKLADESDKLRKRLRESEKRDAKERDEDTMKSGRKKKTVADEVDAWYKRLRRNSAILEQKLGLEEIARQKKSAKDVADWRDRLIRNSAALATRIGDQEHAAKMRSIAQEERERKASLRRIEQDRIKSFQGVRRLMSGAMNLGAGIAYSGLLGEENSAKVLNTVIAVESARNTTTGIIDLLEGLRNIRAGAGMAGAAGGAAKGGAGWLRNLLGMGGSGLSGIGMAGRAAYALPSAGSVAAPVAAVLATIGAGVSAYGTIGDIRKYGFMGGAEPGSWRETAAGYMVSDPWTMTAKWQSDAALKRAEASRAAWMAPEAVADREKSARDLSTSMAAMSAHRLDVGRTSISGAYAALRGDIADYKTLTGIPGTDDQQLAAVERMKKAYEVILDITRKQHAEGLKAGMERLRIAEKELSSARENLETRQKEAKSARDLVRGDMARYGIAGSREQMTVRNIAAKRRTGVELSVEEIKVAQGYKEFSGAADDSAVARARRAGAEWIFQGGLMDQKRLEEAAKRAEAEVAKAELTTKSQVQIVHKIEADESWKNVAIEGFEDKVAAISKTVVENALREYSRKNTFPSK